MRYNRFFSILLILALFLWPKQSIGQSNGTFRRINQKEGLSNSRVTSIVKEQHGFVWIATKNGLNRYDGLEFKVFTKQNSELGANDISHLFIDTQNRLWVATLGGGISIYHPETDSFITYKNELNSTLSLPSNQINTIFQDSKGKIWIGTENGLCYFEETKEQFISYQHQENTPFSLSHNHITDILEDDAGNIWIATFGGGLNKFSIEEKKLHQISLGPDSDSEFIYSLEYISNNTLLIGTGGGGLIAYETLTGKHYNFLRDQLNLTQEIAIIRSIYVDSKNEIWIGSDGQGIVRGYQDSVGNYATYTQYKYNTQLASSLSGNAIYDIYEDESENIWIGTAWNGINVFRKNENFEVINSDVIGTNPTPVLSIFRNDEGLFLGLDGNGITFLNESNNKVQYFNQNSSPPFNGKYVQLITETKDGLLWLGTFTDGLIRFNRNEYDFKKFEHQKNNKNSISYNDIRDIEEDSLGNLWIATWGGGLNYFNRSENKFSAYKEFKEGNSINSNNIISIEKDEHLIWLATFGGGVNCLNTETGKFSYLKNIENETNSLSGNNVFSLLKDSHGYLWIGTSGEGINQYNPKTKTIERFDQESTIRFSTVTSIIEDNSGSIWFSTKQGIYNYNYNTKQFSRYRGINDEFHINSCFKDEQGRLYFGGINGVVRFNPEEFNNSEPVPQVRLTNFKLFNNEVAIGEDEILQQHISNTEKIVLKPDLNVLTFEFAALQFPFSENCEYAIQLFPFDEDWRKIGSDRTVTYTNLSPGNYQFRVKSRMEGAEWQNNFTSLNIEILTPFYLQWWAFLIYGLMILVLFYLFRKYIIAWEHLKANLKLEKITHEKDIELYNFKQQFFTNISHEIRTPVTLILSAVKKLANSDKKEGQSNNAINTLQKNGEQLLNLVNELLDFKKFENNEIKLKVSKSDFTTFSKEIFLSFKEIAEQKNITFEFVNESTEVMLWYDPNQLEKVIYNLLSNAFKFTDSGGTIIVKITNDSDQVILKVIDSGHGIAKKKLNKIFKRFYQVKNEQKLNDNGFGLGLAISKEIMLLHKGFIYAESEENVGSIFSIALKKGNHHFNNADLMSAVNEEEVYSFNALPALNQQLETDYLNEFKDKNILIIEDNPEIRTYLTDFLGNKCKIIEAIDGTEGLKMAFEHLPDLIISDIMMPNMDGLTFTKRIKEDIRTSHIPVILLTAKASSHHKLEGYETGADAYIVKPFDEKLLLGKMKSLLQNRKLLKDKFSKEAIIAPGEYSNNQKDKRFLEQLMQAIQSNLDSEDLNAEFLSKEMGLSHSVIYKKTKALTGMTYVEFVRDFKLKIAKKLIIEDKFSISEACYKVGYADKKYFSKLFKQKFGVNPSEYYSS